MTDTFFRGDYNEYKGMQLGKFWRDEITQEVGVYHCPNNDEKEYKKKDLWAIGMVKHSDEEKRHKLDKAMRYMTTADQYVLAKLGKYDRVYQRGVIRKEGKSLAGRPRSSKLITVKNRLKMSETRKFGHRNRRHEYREELASKGKSILF